MILYINSIIIIIIIYIYIYIYIIHIYRISWWYILYFYVFHVCKFAFFLLVAVYIMFAQLYIHLVFFSLSATAAGMASVGDIACDAAHEFLRKANGPVPRPARTDIESVPESPSPVVFVVDDSDLEQDPPDSSNELSLLADWRIVCLLMAEGVRVVS